MALPASSARRAAATSIWPRWRRSAWMRASNGVSDPRAPSVDNAPVAKRRAEQRLGLEQADQRVGGRELRAVEQREPLLGLKRDRLEAGFGERGGGGRDAIADARFADADHRRRHMGERREIARTRRPSLATGTTGVTPRASIASMRPSVSRLDARGALGEAAELQRHHQPRRRDRDAVRRRPAACDSTMLR